MRAHMAAGRIILKGRHRVSELRIVDGTATGVAGEIFAPATTARGETSSRAVIGDFEIEAGAILLTAGGVGGNHEMVRRNWPVARLGPAPQKMISGVPAHVDGRMLEIAEAAGGRVINRDRMWHYTEGVTNHDPIWPMHGIRILPGPSSLWFDALGNRMEPPALPGFDTLDLVPQFPENRSVDS